METELPGMDFEDIQTLRGPLIPLLFSLALFPLGWMFGYALLGAVIASIFIVVCLATAYYDGVGRRGVQFLNGELSVFTPQHGCTLVNLSKISNYKFEVSMPDQSDCPSIAFNFDTGELEPKEFYYTATKHFDEHCLLRDLISERIARQWLVKLENVEQFNWTEGFIIERSGIKNETARIGYDEIYSASQKEGYFDNLLELRGRDGATFEFGTKWLDFYPFCELLRTKGVNLPELTPFQNRIPDLYGHT